MTTAAYGDAIERATRKALALGDRALRGLFGLLSDARKRVIADVADTDWSRAHYGVLQRRIDGAMGELAQDLGGDIRGRMRERYDLGGEDLDALLTRFGGEGERLNLPIDRRRLSTFADFGADLISRVARDTRADISRILRLGLIGERDPQQVIADIGRSLVTREGDKAPGVFGDAMARASVIYRTETGRMYSIAGDVRARQHEQIRPGLRKGWMHSGSRNGRPSHIQAAEDYGVGGDPGPIPVPDEFELDVSEEEARGERAGIYRARYPRDGRLPAFQGVNCGCTTFPYREAWGAPRLSEAIVLRSALVEAEEKTARECY